MPYDYMIDAARQSETAPAHQSMIRYAKEMVLQRTPEEISAVTEVPFDAAASAFMVDTLGQKITVSWPDCKIVFTGTDEIPQVFWQLAILHYLGTADGIKPANELITFRMLPGGQVRGGGFDRECTQIIADTFGDKPLDRVQKACSALGAVFTKTNADLGAVFPFLPLYPMTMKIWMADEEMAGSGQILLDRHADHYLSMEDAVTAGSMLLEFLSFQYKLMFS